MSNISWIQHCGPAPRLQIHNFDWRIIYKINALKMAIQTFPWKYLPDSFGVVFQQQPQTASDSFGTLNTNWTPSWKCFLASANVKTCLEWLWKALASLEPVPNSNPVNNRIWINRVMLSIAKAEVVRIVRRRRPSRLCQQNGLMR